MVEPLRAELTTELEAHKTLSRKVTYTLHTYNTCTHATDGIDIATRVCVHEPQPPPLNGNRSAGSGLTAPILYRVTHL